MIDAYTFGPSGKGAFRMRFSYHEVLYITIEGLETPPIKEDVIGWRLSVGLVRTGTFSSSEPLLNQIYETTVTNYL